MKKVPISVIIDDPAPIVHVYREHSENNGLLPSGVQLLPRVPTEFLMRFCDMVETFNVRGKFSIVPMPGCRGDIVNGIEGVGMSEIREWLDIANTRLGPYFDFCPEILTHHKAVNLANGEFLDENEEQWATHQNRASLADYISRALELLCQAGIPPTGVTSPWSFGVTVEDAYVAAICDAFYRVMGKKKSWYFLHTNTTDREVRPAVRFREEDRCVVEVVRTVDDVFWKTIESPRTDRAYIESIADELITADGTSGQIISTLNRDSYPILVTHWQSLFSNGKEVGLQALAEVARRVKQHLSERVEWRNFTFLMDEAIDRAGM